MALILVLQSSLCLLCVLILVGLVVALIWPEESKKSKSGPWSKKVMHHCYSASSSPLLLRGPPDYSIDTVSELTH